MFGDPSPGAHAPTLPARGRDEKERRGMVDPSPAKRGEGGRRKAPVGWGPALDRPTIDNGTLCTTACLSPSRVGARGLAVGILVERRRPDLAIEASPAARTHVASPAPRWRHGAKFLRGPGTPPRIIPADIRSMMMLPDMPAARLDVGRHHQRDRYRRRDGERYKLDRIWAHSPLSRLRRCALRSTLRRAPLHHMPSPLPFFRSGSSLTGGGHILQSMPRALPGHASPPPLHDGAAGRMPCAAQERRNE